MSPTPASGQLISDGFVVLRTTLLPFDVYRTWAESAVATDAGEQAEARHRRTLRELIADPVIRHALFLASPSFESALAEWQRDPDGKRGQKTEASLVRYLARMTSRPTPFGLFAGCAVVDVGEPTRLRLAPLEQHRTHTRLDMGYLSRLADTWSKEQRLRQALSYKPNNGLYTSCDRLRYAETVIDAAGDRSYRLAQVESTDYLESVLERAADGEQLAALAEHLSVEADVSHEEAVEFLHELIDNQLLTSELAPAVTGADGLSSIIDVLRPLGTTTAADVAVLEGARTAMADLDAAGLGVPAERFRTAAAALEALPAAVDVNRLFHVDISPAVEQATLGRGVIAEVERAVHLLHRIAPRAERADLLRFRDEFQRRYQDREVSLMEALDEDTGIGFDPPPEHQADPSTLIADLPLSADPEQTVPWGDRDAALFRRLCSALQSNDRVMHLDDTDLDALAVTETLPLPPALAANVTLSADSDEALDRGDFEILWHGAFGPSGALYLGRFCQGDADLCNRVRAHLTLEESSRPEALFAEIVHLPQGRMGNILGRPVLRRHEIACHGRSGARPEALIELGDLTVSVRGSRIVLWSRRHGREVVPRLTSAHNASNAELGIYRFLTALQVQGVANWLAWEWGVLQSAPFLPRVQAGKLVLSRARWRLGRSDIERLEAATSLARARAVDELRARLQLPRWVVVVEADRQLPLDLESPPCVDVLCSLARDREAFDLAELYPDPSCSIVEGPAGRHAHEIVIPFTVTSDPAVETRSSSSVEASSNDRAPASEQSSRAPASEQSSRAPASEQSSRTSGDNQADRVFVSNQADRVFVPGDDWLYAKVYVSPGVADTILLDAIAPIIDTWRSDESIDRWFFMRFRDPDPHLRVRFHGAPATLAGHVLPGLRAALARCLDDGSVHRLQLDTYERELERYGGVGDSMELAEAWFEVDSDATLALLPFLTDDAVELRWLLTLRSVDCMLEDLALPYAVRRSILGGMRDGLRKEFRSPEGLRRELDRRYRELRPAVDAWLAPPGGAGSDVSADLQSIFDQRSQLLQPIAEHWRGLAASHALTEPLSSIALSLVHMNVNRLLRSAARAHELVLYDFLDRHYRSQMARARDG